MDVPPEEAIRFFQSKGLHAGFSWQDTEAEEHLRSFTVAKAMDLDVLADIRKATDRAIEDGETFETFYGELRPKLVSAGWWGRAEMVDPADPKGGAKIVQLGSTRRLRTIFHTNISMAYAKGRWERIEAVAKERPWLMYVAIRDSKTRPEHLRWHGTIRRWDDAFWRTHYPPCGWNCRCYVIQLSDDDLSEMGLQETARPEGWDTKRTWRNRRTEKTSEVPIGIDPGFEHNVGSITTGRDAADRLIGKIDAADEDLQRAAVGKIAQDPMFRTFLRVARRDSADGDWAVAVSSDRLAAAIGARSRVVRLSGETAAKQGGRRLRTDRDIGHVDVEAKDYAVVQHAIDGGELFKAPGGRAHAYVEVGEQLWRAVLKRSRDGSKTYLVTLHKAQPRDLETARRKLEAIDG